MPAGRRTSQVVAPEPPGCRGGSPQYRPVSTTRFIQMPLDPRAPFAKILDTPGQARHTITRPELTDRNETHDRLPSQNPPASERRSAKPPDRRHHHPAGHGHADLRHQNRARPENRPETEFPRTLHPDRPPGNQSPRQQSTSRRRLRAAETPGTRKGQTPLQRHSAILPEDHRRPQIKHPRTTQRPRTPGQTPGPLQITNPTSPQSRPAEKQKGNNKNRHDEGEVNIEK